MNGIQEVRGSSPLSSTIDITRTPEKESFFVFLPFPMYYGDDDFYIERGGVSLETYDILVIGMGPAGMAVSAMAVSMGLKVLAVEKLRVGGECLNCGCIPSKALLKASQSYHESSRLGKYGIDQSCSLLAMDPMRVVREKIASISGKKLMKVFEKVTLLSGEASFYDSETIKVGDRLYRGKRIFISTGTEPFIPPIPGLRALDFLTNENMFQIDKIPSSLTIIGGGAIGTEMAQAFSRLGSKVNVVHMDPHLIPIGDEDGGKLVEKALTEEGVTVRNGVKIEKVERTEGFFRVFAGGEVFDSEQLLVAAGRSPVLEPLHLDRAGIDFDRKGIIVDRYMRTNVKNVYAVGDCNGKALLSHAAMHQGMLALMRSMSPFSLPFMNREKYLVPWAVFTDPEVAQVGLTEKEAKAKGIRFEVVKKDYRSYGRTVADGHPNGFIKVLVGRFGRIYGVTIVGEGASDLVQEWVLAMQHRKGIISVMMTQHPFPSIATINKMVAEDWMMKKMQSPVARWLARFLVR